MDKPEYRVGDKVTVLVDNQKDSVQTCLSPHAVVVEVMVKTLPRSSTYVYRIEYAEGDPDNFGAPMLRERLRRGWR